jgi:two-component system, response regulator YesN
MQAAIMTRGSAQRAPASMETRDPRVLAVIQQLDRQPGRRVSELATHVHVCVSRLERLFKSETGMCLSEYALKVRLESAAFLLRSTKMQVKAIAFEVGYTHVSSFVRAFRAGYREAPGDYRSRLTPDNGSH